MKYLLSLSFIAVLFTNGLAEPIKLALIGDMESCAILTAEMSKDNRFALYERTEIDKVLREHKVVESNASDDTLLKLFPHSDLFAIITLKHLIVFNAKSGIILEYITRGKDVQDADAIRHAADKLLAPDPVFLSIVSVRDTGVPLRYKPGIEKTVLALEQELTRNNRIQLLERTHLGTVINERKLSGKTFPLSASTFLIKLEFEPGSEADIINLWLKLCTPDKKQFVDFRVKNIFTDIDFSAKKSVEGILSRISPQKTK